MAFPKPPRPTPTRIDRLRIVISYSPAYLDPVTGENRLEKASASYDVEIYDEENRVIESRKYQGDAIPLLLVADRANLDRIIRAAYAKAVSELL